MTVTMRLRRLGWAWGAASCFLAALGCEHNMSSSSGGESELNAGDASMEYPATRRDDHVDLHHGVRVADPYRWLEADVRQSEEVAEWVQQQHALARRYLDAIPQREAIQARVRELWDYERYSTPSQQGGKYFYRKNDGLQNQAVLYVADRFDAEGRVLVDPNEWSEDGTIALTSFAPSDDGRYLAYSRSESGSDWQRIHVLEVDTGRLFEDRIDWVRFSGVQWNHEGTGFYYKRYPELPAGEQHQSAVKNQMVYFHRLGDDQADDTLIYRRPDQPDWSFWLQPTNDGQYLVLSISRGTDPQNQVWVREASAPADAPFDELIGDFDNQFWFVGNEGTQFYFFTDLNAPTKRVVAMNIDQPGREHVTEVVPARSSTLDGVSLLDGRFITQYLEDVRPRVLIFDQDGAALGEVELPGFGSVSGFSGDQDDTETFYTFTSYNTPTTIHRYDVTTGDSRLVRRPKVQFDPAGYEVEQVFFTSRDGTRVPMTLAYRKDLPPGQSHPTLLYGYGGFNISLLPFFSPDYVAWMEMGGVLAVANLRGGGEYGEEWHQAGKVLRKQNVFDDFIAAAEWLIEEGRTRSDRLAIMGGSNGGLLVGAAVTQRPELFAAAIPSVGVLDMLRFHHFTAGQFWRDEYGSADNAEEFRALLAYSPYHNVKDGTSYPAILIMTADTDDRVVPMHSFKFAAAMQRAQAGAAPVLLRLELRAGHGGGTPLGKQIEMVADRWAFLAHTLQMEGPVGEDAAADAEHAADADDR